MPIELRLTRTVARRANPGIIRGHLRKAIQIALSKGCSFSTGDPQVSVVKTETGFTSVVRIPCRGTQNEIRVRELVREAVVTRFDPPWLIVDADQPTEAEGEKEPAVDTSRPIGEINLDFPPDAFSRIYGREAQIRRLTDAISLGRDTGWAKRKHTLFLGPPGCGKTETILTFARHLGKEGEAYLWLDATSTTRAGAIEMLMKAPKVPPVLFVEEIEKTQESSLRFLLGLMDERGEVRRTNYRVGNQAKSIKQCVVATCNNDQLLKSMDAGALYSRFANRVYCPEPTRAVLQQILERELTEINGKHGWAVEALRFGYDECMIRDPRELINMVLCGRDRLLDGSYQEDFKATLSPQDRKNVAT